MKYGKHAKRKDRKKLYAVAALSTTGTIPIVMAAPAHATSSASWDAVAQCESGGDWAINHSGDGLSVGGLQFQNPSWQAALSYLNSHGYDTSSWQQTLYQGMPRGLVPSRSQQITAGEALLAIQGPGAWVCNGIVGGVLGASVFEGGVAPTGFLSAPGVVSAPVPVPAVENAPPVRHRHHHYRRHHWVPRPVSASATTYRVVPGDCLSQIAQDQLGDSGQWPALYDQNRAVVGGDPDLILPGQELVINAG